MKSNKHKQLLFVYNPYSGLFSQATDFVHKVVSPGTYQCNLCKITYGGVAMKHEWKSYIASLHIPVVFLHKDEFLNQYPKLASNDLPAVFMKDADKLTVLIPAPEINSVTTMKTLISLLDRKLAK